MKQQASIYIYQLTFALKNLQIEGFKGQYLPLEGYLTLLYVVVMMLPKSTDDFCNMSGHSVSNK